MKKINFLLSSILLMLVFVIPFQNVLAVDVPLKPGTDPNATVPKVLSYSLMSTSSSTSTATASDVTIDLTNNELTLDFYSQVGVVQISIVDRNGFIVCQDAVDTNSSDQLIIPVDYLRTGKYTINISYGTTSLTGSFRLY